MSSVHMRDRGGEQHTMDELYDNPEVEARLGRLYAKVLAWPEPLPREDYTLTLTYREYDILAPFLWQYAATELVEVEEDV